MKDKVVCIGDSLTYAFGVPRPFTWVALAGARLGRPFLNKGINGDTTGGMLARFGRDVAEEKPGVVIIMGGPNDFMAGLPLEAVRANLTAMVRQAEYYAITPVLGVPTRADYAGLSPEWAAFVNGPYVAAQLEAMRDWILSFARAFGFPCLDFAQEFERRAPQPYGKSFRDGLHPTRECQSILADIVVEHPYFSETRSLGR